MTQNDANQKKRLKVYISAICVEFILYKFAFICVRNDFSELTHDLNFTSVFFV